MMKFLLVLWSAFSISSVFSMESSQEPTWYVGLTVVNAKNLPKMDIFGSCDGFVVIKTPLGNFLQTNTIEKEYNPTWNQTFEPIPMNLSSGKLEISLFDADKKGKNELISSVEVSLADILQDAKQFMFCDTPGFQYLKELKLQSKHTKKNHQHPDLTLNYLVYWPTQLQFVNGMEKKRWLEQSQSRMKLYKTLKDSQIHANFFEDLLTLNRFDIVLVLDDSTSMDNRLKSSSHTRWDQLKSMVRIAVEIGTCLDDDGVDLIFLNRAGMDKVNSWDKVQRLFEKSPNGSTPLTQACSKAFAKLRREKPLLVLIATDGAPDDFKSFKEVLLNKPAGQVFVGILACSDVKNDVEFLNSLDEIKDLDVIKHYEEEAKEVIKHTPNANYTLGDHCARFFLGPIFSKYDNLDGV